MDPYVLWLEEKLMFALCPKGATELADNTKKAFRDIIINNFINREESNYGSTYAIRRDLQKWWDGKRR